MIWNREEYIAHMTFEDIGREMFTEQFGPLAMLEKEWRAAGVPEREINLSAFGWDNVKYVDLSRCAVTGPVTGIKPYVVSDNEHERITVDNMGRRCRLCKDSATIALPLDHPVQTMDDWLRVKHWYEFSEDRIDTAGLERAKKLQQDGHLVIAWMPGGFDEPRQLLGEAELCIAFYEEPEMIEDMLSTIADTTLKVFERVQAKHGRSLVVLNAAANDIALPLTHFKGVAAPALTHRHYVQMGNSSHIFITTAYGSVAESSLTVNSPQPQLFTYFKPQLQRLSRSLTEGCSRLCLAQYTVYLYKACYIPQYGLSVFLNKNIYVTTELFVHA